MRRRLFCLAAAAGLAAEGSARPAAAPVRYDAAAQMLTIPFTGATSIQIR